ncbi:MAG: serine/threonine protein kinase, partial [Myxococcales bacterium]|nr:serine/threonine protein kinase [Myxococcales bacterium]
MRLRVRMRAAIINKPEEKVQIARFEIVRRLGAGAMGLVYEVIDPRSGNHLALKTVRTHNPRLLSLFKREFRSLTRVNHPNLVTLYELGRDGSSFFFTMELIRGLTLLRYLWGSEEPPPPPPGGLPASPVIDVDRLRAVLSQLAAGVAALHDAGKLHRDIKPTNVMVTAEGRVVLMDFGFVAEHGGGLLESTQGSMIVGTPAFMPPEQSRAERLDAAADWYSVGATLYHALTGQPPYGGLAMAEMLLLKETQPPIHPRLLARGIPSDLGDLCVELLQPDPAARPDEGELLRRMHAAPWGRAASSSGHSTDPRRRTSMIGLGLPLTRLAALYRRGEDALRVIRVVGSAGHGKTRLVAHLLEILRSQDERPLILR